MKALRTSHKQYIPDQMIQGDNLALRLSKLNSDIDCHGEHDQKDKMLNMLCSYSMNKEQKHSYQYRFKDWQAKIQARQDSLSFSIKATTKCLLGIGNASVHEFGVSLSNPFGVPYISGNAIKGLLSSYLAGAGGDEWYKNPKDSQKSALQVELFGGDLRKEEGSQINSYIGSVVFNDAWLLPTDNKWFVPDIINVHHQSYYGNKSGNKSGNKRFPDGMENPIPIKIAAMSPGLEFFVSMQGDEDALLFLLPVLEQALKEKGMGAKTATGYGRFEFNKTCDDIKTEHQKLIGDIKIEAQTKEDQIKTKRNRQKLSKEGKIVFDLQEQLKATISPQIKTEINKEIKEAEQNIIHWSNNDRQQLAEFMEDFFECTGWFETGKTKKQKDKQKHKKEERIKKIRG